LPATPIRLTRRDGDNAFINRLRTFVDLDAADRVALRSLVEEELAVTRRRDLVVDGYEYRKLGFVRDGFAARYKLLRNGKRQIVGLIMPGDVIGIPGSFFDVASFSVVALTDMNIDLCPLEQFVGLCYRRPKFALALGWLAADEATQCAERLVDIGRRTPIERLSHFLLETQARLAAVGRAGERSFDLPVSQEVLSDALGLSVPHLNRMLSKLRKDGLISVASRHFEFLDVRALQLLAHYRTARLARIPSPVAANRRAGS
jgi:CRP-like cAMP-binding protein